ncbi:hypothetical protein BGZ60DRAFT_552633 [Tricladium varicosporioides]|nr:hypothetical protein BGZ60DRAFT_552633 [Hymenoscyphus varicosporioides]
MTAHHMLINPSTTPNGSMFFVLSFHSPPYLLMFPIKMVFPITPSVNHQLVSHLYSSRAYNIFLGGLNFYFSGWGGCSCMKDTNTEKCLFFMLIGEFDWNNTPGMPQKIMRKVKGTKHKVVLELGQFPTTENLGKFKPHLIEAIG